MTRLRVLALLGTALFGLATAPVRADTHPSRVVTVVVPYPGITVTVHLIGTPAKLAAEALSSRKGGDRGSI